MTDTSLPSWAPRQGAVILAMLEAVELGVREGQPADRVLHKLLAGKKKYGSRDRRVISDSVFSWFRWHGAIGEFPLAKGLIVAWALEGSDWPPALLAIAEELGWSADSLSALSESRQTADTPLADRKQKVEQGLNVLLPEVTTWLPEWWKIETEHLGSFETRLNEHIDRPPTWLRIDQELQPTLHQELLEDGAQWAGEHTPCAYAFTKPGQIKAWLDKHPKGIEIQDLASQQVARICAPEKGQTWWDACAGSGGKGLHLLDLADKDLDLTCTDKRESAVENLVKRARAHGLGKLRHYTLDLTSTNLTFPNLSFDGILVDAPCTGTGTWSRNPDAAWRTEEKDVRQAARRQKLILQNIAEAVPQGKVLVYAVCSLTKSETLEVVEDFLTTTPEFTLDPSDDPITGEKTDGTLTLIPSKLQADGMYIARFMRNSE